MNYHDILREARIRHFEATVLTDDMTDRAEFYIEYWTATVAWEMAIKEAR